MERTAAPRARPDTESTQGEKEAEKTETIAESASSFPVRTIPTASSTASSSLSATSPRRAARARPVAPTPGTAAARDALAIRATMSVRHVCVVVGNSWASAVALAADLCGHLGRPPTGDRDGGAGAASGHGRRPALPWQRQSARLPRATPFLYTTVWRNNSEGPSRVRMAITIVTKSLNELPTR